MTIPIYMEYPGEARNGMLKSDGCDVFDRKLRMPMDHTHYFDVCLRYPYCFVVFILAASKMRPF